MKELLFEIGTEEIPAGFIKPAIAYLEKSMAERLTEHQLTFSGIRTAATPRRLTVAVSDLAERQPDRSEQVVGPPKKAAFDAEGAPTAAAAGFARSRGVTLQDLRVIETPRGEYLMVEQDIPGRETGELLPHLLTSLINDIPFAKSMRWGNGDMAFVRPIQWLLALYGATVIDIRVNDIVSGRTTRGHRFMAPDPIEVKNFDDYMEKLRNSFVIADPEKRRSLVIEEVEKSVSDSVGEKGCSPLLDPQLVDTVTNLVEMPWAVCGSFEARFLEIPEAVLVTSMREHQKYFPVVDDGGRLLPRFVAVNNTAIRDHAKAVNGHERVLRARLEDAHFFFREDRKKTLEERRADLGGIIFQNRLGTMAEKTDRLATLSGLLARHLAPEYEDVCTRAALLAKTDLLTEMVGEFPTLQGTMGGEYARLDGEEEAIAAAIEEHYLPLRAGSALPSTTAGAIVGLADRMDTIAGCFAIGSKPTGTTDPFGLRRLGLAIIHIIEEKGFALSLSTFFQAALRQYEAMLDVPPGTLEDIGTFLRDRYCNDLAAQGISTQAIAAATGVGFDDINDCRARIDALTAIRNRESFGILAASYKRIRNIIKDNGESRVDPALFREKEEKELYETVTAVEREMAPLLAAKAYEQALTVLLRIKEPVDRFFDGVMVMTDDRQLRQNRLNLLTALGGLVLKIGDISKMNVD